MHLIQLELQKQACVDEQYASQFANTFALYLKRIIDHIIQMDQLNTYMM